MKPSHIRTPRSLSECYFEVGHYVVEPSMWAEKWSAGRSMASEPNVWSKIFTVGAAVVLAVTVILAILVQPLI